MWSKDYSRRSACRHAPPFEISKNLKLLKWGRRSPFDLQKLCNVLAIKLCNVLATKLCSVLATTILDHVGGHLLICHQLPIAKLFFWKRVCMIACWSRLECWCIYAHMLKPVPSRLSLNFVKRWYIYEHVLKPTLWSPVTKLFFVKH